jgi:hypothetical protein
MNIILKSETDFNWYKKGLDVLERHNHRHIGKPEKYPCKVYSKWEDDPNGPYTYEHNFIYQQEVVCEHCGHKKLVWPDVEL